MAAVVVAAVTIANIFGKGVSGDAVIGVYAAVIGYILGARYFRFLRRRNGNEQ